MSWRTLRDLDAGGFEGRSAGFQRRVGIEMHKRFALPAACLVLGFFALPLALFFQGLKRQSGLLACLGAFFLYYVLLSAGMALAESGVVSPAVALWSPNIFFLLLGLAGMRMVAREREVDFRGLMNKVMRRFRWAGGRR